MFNQTLFKLEFALYDLEMLFHNHTSNWFSLNFVYLLACCTNDKFCNALLEQWFHLHIYWVNSTNQFPNRLCKFTYRWWNMTITYFDLNLTKSWVVINQDKLHNRNNWLKLRLINPSSFWEMLLWGNPNSTGR